MSAHHDTLLTAASSVSHVELFETFYKATDLRKQILHKPAQHSGLTGSFKNNLQLGKGELIKTPSSLCVKLSPVPALWGICVYLQMHGWVQYYGR